MKTPLRTAILAGVLLSSIGFAANVLPDVVEADLSYVNDVTISGELDGPADTNGTAGTVTAMINGTGSVTLMSRQNNGFPRILMYGGTSIKNTRYYSTADQKIWWDGKMLAPSETRVFSGDEIVFADSYKNTNSMANPLVAYQWGANNEEYAFSPAALVSMPVGVSDGTKLWVAYLNSGTWEIGDQYCIVNGGLCIFEVSDVNAIALIKETFYNCPTVANAVVGREPDCAITCKAGYELSADQESCVLTGSESEDDMFASAPDEFFGDPMDMMMEGDDYSGNPEAVRPGYYRYTNSREQFDRISNEGLSGADARLVDRKNAATSVRSTAPEEVVVDGGIWEEIRNLRSKVWLWETEHSAEENVPVELIGDEMISIAAEGEMLIEEDLPLIEADQAPMMEEPMPMEEVNLPMLPSTGPAGIIAGLAALGVGAMAFGRRRK